MKGECFVSKLKDAKKISLCMKNIRVIDPARSFDKVVDVRVDNGVFRLAGGDLDLEEVDCSGLWLVPGLVDMHVHLREPGEEHKETIETGSQAAVCGGFVAVASMPNTKPPNDNETVTRFIVDRARSCASCYVYPVGAITRGLKGKELTDMGSIFDAGAVAFSDDGNPVMDSAVMRRCLEYSRIFWVVVISHCEDRALSADGVMNEGRVSYELGLRGIPKTAEEVMVFRDVSLAKYTGARIHIAHVSTKGSVEIIRRAKEEGVSVTAETAPHYFSLTEEKVYSYDSRFKVNPPLRTQEDVEAVIEGLRDGTIDVIATDHAPHSLLEKDIEFDFSASGMIGLETSLSVSLELVRKGFLTPIELVSKMSTNPARILNIPFGFLEDSGSASFAVIDPNEEWTVRCDDFFSKGVNCPFEGEVLKGRVKLTVIEGKAVFGREEFSWLVK